MEWLLVALPALACGAMMLLICVPMMMGRKNNNDDSTVSKEEINALREEIAQLRGEGTPGADSTEKDRYEVSR